MTVGSPAEPAVSGVHYSRPFPGRNRTATGARSVFLIRSRPAMHGPSGEDGRRRDHPRVDTARPRRRPVVTVPGFVPGPPQDAPLTRTRSARRRPDRGRAMAPPRSTSRQGRSRLHRIQLGLSDQRRRAGPGARDCRKEGPSDSPGFIALPTQARCLGFASPRDRRGFTPLATRAMEGGRHD